VERYNSDIGTSTVCLYQEYEESFDTARIEVQTLWSNSAIFRTIGIIIGSGPDFKLTEVFLSPSRSLIVSPKNPGMETVTRVIHACIQNLSSNNL